MTIHASIIESSLEIVNMLRRYEFDASTSTKADGVRMREFMNMLRSDEFISTMDALTSTKALPSPQDEEDDKWRLKTEVMELFNKALDNTFPEFTENDNVLSIWPKIKKSNSYQNIKGPKDVGKSSKHRLVELKSDMIEGEPWVYGVGFVTIKLSGKWMAENIHKMLEMGNGMSLPPDMDEHFRTVEEDGEVLIYVKDEGNMKPLIREKSRTRKSRTRKSRDGCFGYPLEDLGALWHGLVGEKAYWIVCVTPTQQQDYVENCLNAAQHAGDEMF
ncbi:hypothetical protein Tco_0122672 [Tanacetum coccineum]